MGLHALLMMACVLVLGAKGGLLAVGGVGGRWGRGDVVDYAEALDGKRKASSLLVRLLWPMIPLYLTTS
jgi:hypothetical protein